MTQSPEVRFDFTVAEIVTLGRTPHRGQRPPADDRAIVAQALSVVGMGDFAERSILSLSGGERQRVFLAKAIAQVIPAPESLPGNGSLLLLDEPTSALDLAQQVVAMTAIRRIADRGAAVLAVLHASSLKPADCAGPWLASRSVDRGWLAWTGRLVCGGGSCERGRPYFVRISLPLLVR